MMLFIDLEVKGYSTKYFRKHILLNIQHITITIYFSLNLNVSVATKLIQVTTKLIITKLVLTNVIEDVQEIRLNSVVVT